MALAKPRMETLLLGRPSTLGKSRIPIHSLALWKEGIHLFVWTKIEAHSPWRGDLLAKRKATGSQAFGHELPKAGPGSSLKPALTREPIISYPNLLGKLLPNTIPLCSYRALSLLQHKGTQTRYSLLPPRKNANYYNGTRGKHPLN